MIVLHRYKGQAWTFSGSERGNLLSLEAQFLRRARKFTMKAIRGWQGGVSGLWTFPMGLKSVEMAGRCMMAKNERIFVRNTKICS